MKHIVILILFLWLLGCSRSETNSAPEILKAVTDLSIQRGGHIGFTFKMIEVFDRDADPLTLMVEAGENYTFSGNSVSVSPDFLGEIFVKVVVSDGKALSNPFYVAVEVTDYIAIMPLRSGNFWVYDDWNTKDSLTKQSKFIVDEPIVTDSFEGLAYRCHWENIDTLSLSVYLGDSIGGGSYFLGADSPDDTLNLNTVRFKYPVRLGQSWEYPAVRYSLSDSEYVVKNMTISCTDTSRYIAVPAGVFKCVEYSIESDVWDFVDVRSDYAEKKFLSYIDGVTYTPPSSRALKKYSLKYWYSPGTGYIGFAYSIDNNVVEKKELVSFNVQ